MYIGGGGVGTDAVTLCLVHFSVQGPCFGDL